MNNCFFVGILKKFPAEPLRDIFLEARINIRP